MAQAKAFLHKADELGIKLDKSELKDMVRNWINKSEAGLSRDAGKVYGSLAEDLKKMSKTQKLAWFRKFQKIAVVATVVGVAVDVKTGFAGEGRHPSLNGVTGAGVEVGDQLLRGLIFADEVEAYLAPQLKDFMFGIGGMIQAPADDLGRRTRRVLRNDRPLEK